MKKIKKIKKIEKKYIIIGIVLSLVILSFCIGSKSSVNADINLKNEVNILDKEESNLDKENTDIQTTEQPKNEEEIVDDSIQDKHIEEEKVPIIIKEKYINLTVGETKKLFYSNVNFASVDNTVVEVSSSGIIKGKKRGITSIVISNDTDIKYINVFVCNSDIDDNTTEVEEINHEISNFRELNNNNNVKILDPLVEIIKNSIDTNIYLLKNEYRNISSEALEELYKLKKVINIQNNGYEIIVDGKEINNYSEGLNSVFDIKTSKDYENSYCFEVNRKLPGKIELKFTNSKYKKKYIYVYNAVQKKYIMLSDKYKDTIDIKCDESYLITDIDLDKYEVDIKIIVIMGIILIAFCVIYIFVKKNYWFW